MKLNYIMIVTLFKIITSVVFFKYIFFYIECNEVIAIYLIVNTNVICHNINLISIMFLHLILAYDLIIIYNVICFFLINLFNLFCFHKKI